MVRLKEPAGVVFSVEIDSVVVPDAVTLAGTRLAVVPVGSPVTPKLTVPL
jgi:hypothetical protein